MKIRFKQAGRLEGDMVVCGFSGASVPVGLDVAPGSEFTVQEVVLKHKVKGRGGAYHLCTLIFHDGSCFDDVPSNMFEETESE